MSTYEHLDRLLYLLLMQHLEESEVSGGMPLDRSPLQIHRLNFGPSAVKSIFQKVMITPSERHQFVRLITLTNIRSVQILRDLRHFTPLFRKASVPAGPA